MKKLFISILLYALALSGNAKGAKRIVHPCVDNPETICLAVEEVSTAKDTTTLKMRMFGNPGRRLGINKGARLEADGKHYQLIGTEGITPDEVIKFSAYTDTTFSLKFEALPKSVKTFNFAEGNSHNHFRLNGIHTDRSISAANLAKGKAQLPEPRFEEGTATFSGKILNYDPNGENTSVNVYPRAAMGSAVNENDYVVPVDSDGTFSISFALNQNPTPCFVRLPGYYGPIYFCVGEETSLTVDVKKRWHDGHHGAAGSAVFEGALSDINNALATITGHDLVWDSFNNTRARKKVYKDSEELVADVKKLHKQHMEKLEYQPFSDAVKAFFLTQFDGDLISSLTNYFNLHDLNNVPDGYYDFYKEYGMGSPALMWYCDYDGLISNNLMIFGGHRGHDYVDPATSSDMLQKMIDSGSLLAGEVELVNKLKVVQADTADLKNRLMAFMAENKDAFTSFLNNHSKQLEVLNLVDDINRKNTTFRELSGVESPEIEALMTTYQFARHIEDRNVLAPELVAEAKERLPKNCFDYVMAKNAAMEQMMNKANFNVLEITPSDDAEKILAEIAKANKGKVIYIDIWAVWCSPCLHAISGIEPVKKEYADKVAFVYLADESSPKEAWEEKIKSIDGSHMRLAQTQMNSLMARFGFNGYPSYIVIGKDGTISYFGFIGHTEEAKQLIDTALAK